MSDYQEQGNNMRPGDWNCEGCGAHNFASRNACFKCRVSKDGSPAGGYDKIFD